MARGEVIVRSNITDDEHGWDVVPGELLPVGRMRHQTTRQHKERMYYERCSICRRTIAAIKLDGCNRCRYAEKPTTVAGRRSAYEALVERARTREAEENRRIEVSRPYEVGTTIT